MIEHRRPSPNGLCFLLLFVAGAAVLAYVVMP